MTHRAVPRRPTRVATAARSGAAAAAVLTVVAAPPLLLALLIGDPLPHQLPTGDVLSRWLRAPLSDRATLDVIAVLAWAVWAHFCGCLVAEFARQTRGLSIHVPLGGINQRIAGHLVAAVLVAGQTVVLSALGSGGALTPAVAVASTSPVSGIAPTGGSVARSPVRAPYLQAAPHRHLAPTGTEYKEYVVAPPHGRHHDNLWDIAARHLGDPLRWREIFALNDGRQMSDGQRMIRASLIQPGWVLRMPPDSTGLPQLPGSHHGDPPSARQSTPTPTGPPQRPDAHRHEAGHHHPNAHQTHDLPPKIAELPVAPPPERSSTPEPRAPQQVAESVPPRRATHSSPAVPIGAGLSVAALAVLAALERRRRIAARRRTPGSRLARPGPDLISAESRLRREAGDAETVAATIRLAVALVANRDPDLTVRAAWHHPDGTVELLVDTARSAPEPFSATDRGWQLAPADQGYLFAVGEHTDPAPLLAPVGRSGDAVCYVNLEVAGLVALDGGDGDGAAAVIAGVARALAAVPWAKELTRLVVPARMRRAVFGLDRVEVLDDDPAEAFEHLIAYTDAVTSATRAESLAQARRSGDDDAVGVVLLAGFAPTEIPDQLRVAAMSPASPIVAMLAGSDSRAQIWTLRRNGLTIPGIGEVSDPLRANADDIDASEQLLIQALDVTPAPAEDPTYVEADLNCPPDGEQRAIEVLVLGPVEVNGTGRVRRTPVLGLILFLAMHRRPVTSQQLSAALWPDREHNGHVLRSRMSEARGILDGGIIREGQTWQLADTVGCDWQRFQALAGGDATDQIAALGLIRGRPFDGFDAEWLHVDGYMHTVETAIVDLALRVAERAIADDDPATASTATAAGLRASPYDERLYRLAMNAAAARGATGEVKTLRHQLDRVLEEDIEPDDHIEPATIATYDRDIRPPRRATG